MTPTASPVLRLPLNTAGRDFVFTDPHAEYDAVFAGLKAVEYDGTRDRLFCLGDTIDRGTQPLQSLLLLAMPGVHAILGNHEAHYLSLHADGEPDHNRMHHATASHGTTWWRHVDATTHQSFLNVWRTLPIAIEVETQSGRVGLVHAEVPLGMAWPEFLAALEAGNAKAAESALWGRTRHQFWDESGVAGIDRVFVGHTPMPYPRKLGNIVYLDTGYVFGVQDNTPMRGRLTLTTLTAEDETVLGMRELHGFLDLRV